MEESKIVVPENTEQNAENAGNIKISEEVVSTIAGIAVNEVKGVCGMGGSITGDIAQMLGKKSLSKGVKVAISEKEVAADISVIIEYGVRIPEVAWEIQENVKKSIESMTGLLVSKVNIHVVGVEFKEPAAEVVSEQEEKQN
ncbi:MAG: Asp23/Gls24 family envelope stress response protein [Ruminococcaceae bacterium]|nr:Asp23/Gls24 family envelope stress response protein [Oscillospiraceae bacterium]